MKTNACIDIFRQISNALLDRAKSSDIIRHPLEKGLANEEIVRQVLGEFLPKKYGIAKGKVINDEGKMSRQCDLIIYDSLNCPTLFIDDNRNQILPVEGVYFVFEIKSVLSKEFLKDSFECLKSVRELVENRSDKSVNSFINLRPPGLGVLAFNYRGNFFKLKDVYLELSKAYKVSESFHSYSQKSPGFKRVGPQKYLVSEIMVVNKGYVHHMLDASVDVREYSEYTLGVFLTGLLTRLDQIRLESVDSLGYFNLSLAEEALTQKKKSW